MRVRRLLLAAGGFVLTVIASVAVANAPPEAAAPADDSQPAQTESVESERPLPITAADAELQYNAKYQDLLRQNADLTAALADVQQRLQRLEAETQFKSALAVLKRIADRYPQSEAGQAAALLLRTLNAANVLAEGDESAAAADSAGDAARPAYVDFGAVVVNLDEGRLNRYLKVGITLQLNQASYARASRLVIANKALLQDALLKHLADKTLEDIRGSSAQERLRQDIKDRFNQLLFPDGAGEISQVLFDEFVVQ